MKQMKLSVGVSDFEKIRSDGYYYIDKSCLLYTSLVRKFSEKEILPYAHQMDVEAHFVPGLIQKIADLGFMGINVPEEYGLSLIHI